jgi:hypothetical protein
VESQRHTNHAEIGHSFSGQWYKSVHGDFWATPPVPGTLEKKEKPEPNWPWFQEP